MKILKTEKGKAQVELTEGDVEKLSLHLSCYNPHCPLEYGDRLSEEMRKLNVLMKMEIKSFIIENFKVEIDPSISPGTFEIRATSGKRVRFFVEKRSVRYLCEKKG